MKGAGPEMQDAGVEALAVVIGQRHARPGMAERGGREPLEGACPGSRGDDVGDGMGLAMVTGVIFAILAQIGEGVESAAVSDVAPGGGCG